MNVTMPGSVAHQDLLENLESMPAFLVTIAMVFLSSAWGLVTNLMLRHIVINPVVRMSQVTERVSTGDLDAPQFDTNSKDEIGTLAASFNRMRRSLEKAMQMLK